MKHFVLSSAFAILSTFVAGQSGVTILKVGETDNLVGTTIYEYLDPEIYNTSNDPGTTSMYSQHFIVTNETGEDKQWQIRRVLLDTPSSWNDNFSWGEGHYPAFGSDYLSPSTTTLPAPTVLNNTSTWLDFGGNSQTADLGIEIMPSYIANETASYRYYLYETQSGNLTDSFTVVFNYALSLYDKGLIHYNLYPNPTSTQITIETNFSGNQTLVLINAFGQSIEEVSMFGNVTLDVSHYDAGVYFLLFFNDLGLAAKERLVVQ